MNYALIYHAEVKKTDLRELDAHTRDVIKRAIETRLAVSPEKYSRPLKRSLKGYWRLGVGDYRIVFKIQGSTILILGILHRSKIYQQVGRRRVE